MKIGRSLSSSIFSIVLLLSITMLPGCRFLDWFKEKFGGAPTEREVRKEETDNSEVLFSMDTTIHGTVKKNMPRITQKSFDEYKAQIIKKNPGLKEMLTMVPQFERQIFDSFKNEILLNEWAEREKITQTPEYKKRRAEYIAMIDRALPVELFEEEISKNLKVDKSQAEKYYEEHKTTDPRFQRPPFVKTPGGVSAVGVSFKTEKEANEFLTKAKAAGANFNQAVKNANKTITDFGTVSAASANGVDKAIVNQLITLKDIPSTFMVKGAKDYWVVRALKKTETEYAPVADVHEFVIKVMEQDKEREKIQVIQKKLADLEKEFNATVNEEALSKRIQPAEDAEMTGEEEVGMQPGADAQQPTTTPTQPAAPAQTPAPATAA